jgi:DNA-binding transcriptional regulator YdaS (Cro superfamily)
MARTFRTLPVVRKAGAAVGGIAKLAELMGISSVALYKWRQVPAARALELERLTNGAVTRHELRPDIYPDERSAA